MFELTPGTGGQWKETVIHTFNQTDGSRPAGGVIFDKDGNLYGTAQHGGKNHYVCQEYLPGCGTVFKLTPSRNGYWSETILYDFGNSSSDGFFPSGSLTIDASGNLYGAAGIVFRLSHGSWKEQVLFDFSNPNDGANPNGNLVFDGAGNLYGTALLGANSGCPNYSYQDNGCGTVFKLSPGKGGGWKEQTLYRFTGQTDGGVPIGGVVFDSAGNLYGAVSTKGIADAGAVFRVSQQGSQWKESTVYGFTSSDGSTPESGLVSDGQGNFYGTSVRGGNGGRYCQGNCGTVYKLARDAKGRWTRSVLYSFKGGNDGAAPTTGVILDQAANLYGTTFVGGQYITRGSVYKVSNTAGHWSTSVLYSFQGGTDGSNPNSALIFDSSGNLYGTTEYGGIYGYGTVYELTPSGDNWTESVLYSFHGSSDGAGPNGGLAFDESGNLYGVTNYGGENCSGYGCGVVFELSPSSTGWTETVLYAFSGGNDGSNPHSGLVFDSFGHLYGTTFNGGDPNCYGSGNNGGGTVFELSLGLVWTETVIHSFGGRGGAERHTGPAFDSTRNLHGTPGDGGRPPKCDTEKRDRMANLDGADPEGSLVFDSAGNLFGTTAFGGYSPFGCYYDGYGTVFELSPSTNGQWKETVLRRFTGADGQNPVAGVILDSMGNLYGTTQNGGDVRGEYNPGFGTVFEVTP